MISIVTLVNKSELYEQNVKLSTLEYADEIQYIKIEDAKSASEGLNRGLLIASNDIVICCHQDIRFLEGWKLALDTTLEELSKCEDTKGWKVLGLAGTTFRGDKFGNYSRLDMVRNGLNERFISVQTIDCSCIILNKRSGLRFDEGLKFFHMYGEDIALQSILSGQAVFVIRIPSTHLSFGTTDESFYESVRYMANKWKYHFAVIHTTCGSFKTVVV